MRKLKNIFISGILSVCMVVTSLPATLFAQEAETVQEDNGNGVQEDIQENINNDTHQDTRREIISFTELPDEVKEQVVEVGTPVENLELPDTLTALCRISNETKSEDGNTDSDKKPDFEKDDKQQDEGKEEKPEDDSDKENEDETGDTGKESEDESGDSDNKSGDDSEKSDNGDGEKTENSDKDSDGTEDNTDEETNVGETGEENADTVLGGADEVSVEPSGTEGNADIGNAYGAEREIGKENADSAEANKAIEKQETVTVTMRKNYAMPNDVAEIKELSYEVKIENVTDVVEKGELETEKETKIYEETLTIDSITWKSLPEYDSEIEGVYIFTPVISDVRYTLSEDVKLPEINVTVAEAEMMLEDEELPDVSESEFPKCGIIRKNTTWNFGVLYDGTLIVEPGITLTINEKLEIRGNVTIKGGGTIKRGNERAHLDLYNDDVNLTVSNITIDGASISSTYSMIRATGDHSRLVFTDDCVIQNCNGKDNYEGAICVWRNGTVILDNMTIRNCIGNNFGAAVGLFGQGDRATLVVENAIIEECDAFYGTAICAQSGADIIIKNGTFKNNKAGTGGCIYVAGFGTVTIYDGEFIGNTARQAGGCICINGNSALNIYGGNFIENTAETGGCIGDNIYQLENNSIIDISGGYFEGNTCTYANGGGGAVYNAVNGSKLILSSDAHFMGNGDYGTDGIMLDTDKKVWLSGTLTYPATIYAEASEGRVIAEGTDDYTLSIEKDLSKIIFVDTGNSGETYYIVLDKENNQIKLSKTEPEYGLYINYISNGAQGQVVDETKYKAGDTITVKPADELSMEGYTFKEWNTQLDGEGTVYHPGDKIENITDDITLYAIFEKLKTLSATFYSGGADQKVVKSEFLAAGAKSVTITAPELDDMEGWTKLGWSAGKDRYLDIIEEGSTLSISQDTSYYGIYGKNVTLSYDANGANAGTDLPESEIGKCLANVHEEITYKAAEFEVAGEITPDNSRWEFTGWNTESDGTEDLYIEGDQIEIIEDTTLYATFEIYPYAYFYSGKAGEREVKKTNAVKKAVIAPPLREKTGWEEIGWDDNRNSYEGNIKQGDAVTVLINDTSFYGVYKKEVTLSYSILNNEVESTQVPQSSKQTRYANVNEEAVTYKDFVSGDFVSGDSVSDDPDSFEFDIALDISQDGYEFLGWNTKEDGTGTFYRATDTARNKISIKEDTVLYAILRMPPAATFYSGDAIHRETINATFSDGINATLTAPALDEMDGWIPLGWSTDETGYSGSIAAGSIIALSENTSYYGIYKKEVELSYDANGWVTDNPEKQSGFCYANVHEDITREPVRVDTIPPISRAGYSFMGWSTSKDTTGAPDVDCYRPNESIELEDSVTLYAHMIDDIDPVLGEASYNSGYTGIENWLVHKKDLVITVPITEEGSGVNKIIYALTSENGETVTGEALMGDAYVPRQVRQAAVVQLDVVGGKMYVASGRTDVNNDTVAAQYTTAGEQPEAASAQGAASDKQPGTAIAQDITADKQPRTTVGQVGTTDGQIQARITISEDYKGTVSLKCLDNSGNSSPDKLLTATGGGVIVEDNAPQITFVNKNTKNTKAVVTVSVSDDVDTDKNSRITGGIASITYQVDNKQEQNITTKNFAEEIVPSCEFSVDISGAGEHTLKVTAIDNAGNESQQSTKVNITAKSKKTTVIKQNSKQSNSYSPVENKNEFVPLVKTDKTAPKPEPSKNSEPATGDNSMRVEVYATIAMIAGLLYVLMYFSTGNNGMTEEEKNETVSRILSWAKKGGRCSKFAAIVAIFCVLFYYHSIGKRVNVEWNEVVGS